MYEWLRRILLLAETGNVPTMLGDKYWMFSTDHDEEISSQALIDRINGQEPGSAISAWRSQNAILEAVAAERAALQARTTLTAERLVASLGDAKGRLSLSVLVDHSGSMKGDKTQLAMVIAECVSQLALKLGLPFEILGFTTVGWRGDPVRDLWNKRGCPDAPGRLCALRHIVYSDFDSPRMPDLRAMFLPDLLKENVDGEAVLWAADRARKSDADRHLIIVISDGAPVDDSTLSVNPPDFLWEHLLSVIADVKSDGMFSIAGVGLDHDVGRIYDQSVKLMFFGDVEKIFLPFVGAQITDAFGAPGWV